MVLPDKFKCALTNWDYIYTLCRNVADQVKASGYQPDTIVALARGGWFGGRVLCDLLGLDDLISLKTEHYTGTAMAGSGPRIRYPLSDGAVKGKRVLIVDDITDTGKSLMFSRDHILEQGPLEVRTATLHHLFCSTFVPDYLGEQLVEWAWVIYPWNFIEDMVTIISRLMASEGLPMEISAIRRGLYTHHSLDTFAFEIAQPGRLLELMDEMTRRGIVRKTLNNAWELC